LVSHEIPAKILAEDLCLSPHSFVHALKERLALGREMCGYLLLRELAEEYGVEPPLED
jgi:hypothetical protein